MCSIVESRIRHAIRLQKESKRKLFFPDEDQWLSSDGFCEVPERVDNEIAKLFSEIESSAIGFKESAFYLVVKQLFDCRKTLECKIEQRLGPLDNLKGVMPNIYIQEIWPLAPYISQERLVRCPFEELYPVEHLASLIRLCVDLIYDCELVFKKDDAELVCDVLKYQLERTETALRRVGYSFVYPDLKQDADVKPERMVMLGECRMHIGNPEYQGELKEISNQM